MKKNSQKIAILLGVVFLLIGLVFLLVGCQDIKFFGSHAISNFAGLHRIIKVYSPFTGQPIAEYETKSKVNYDNDMVEFFVNDKRIVVKGNVIIVMEEK
jgi:hypothetical protein